MRILLLQVPWYGENCFSNHVRDALSDLGQEVGTVMLGSAPSSAVVSRAKAFRPDVVVVFMGHYLTPETVTRLRQAGWPVMVLWENDDPWRFSQLSLAWAPHFDLHVTNDPYSVALYGFHRIPNVMHVPFGCNPRLHFPPPKGGAARHQVSFVGSCHQDRVELLRPLAPYGLRIWGDRAWASTPLGRFYQGGPVYKASDLREVYQSSKVNLNIHHNAFREVSSTGTFTNQRPYEILACGGFCLTDWRDHTAAEFGDGVHLAFYRSPRELPDLVEHYLRHEDERQRIAAAGCRLVHERYTYRDRLIPLLDTLERAVRDRAALTSGSPGPPPAPAC